MPPRPKSPYAVQKLAGEYYASVFHSCFDLETVALRFFNVFGERQDPSSPYSGVLSLFFKALVERLSLIHIFILTRGVELFRHQPATRWASTPSS